MRFTKMQGLGNDYVYVDCFDQAVENAPELARRVSDRRFGIGSDGLILICPSDVADVRMEMYNADGSRGEMCGNGLRCVVRYHHDRHGSSGTEIHAETDAGIKKCELVHGDGDSLAVRVDMGAPILERAKIPMLGPDGHVVAEQLHVQDHALVVTCVSMGNPHCVSFVEDVAGFPVGRWGRSIEHLPVFPNRVNVEFVQIVSPTELIQRTWERGSGETFACGTGACAVAVAARLNDIAGDAVTIHLTGGDLHIEWKGDPSDPVFMTGPAEYVFDGTYAV